MVLVFLVYTQAVRIFWCYSVRALIGGLQPWRQQQAGGGAGK
jgi:hypothetical protein